MKSDKSRHLLHEADELGHEARIVQDDQAALKLWLRLLACTNQIEDEIRIRLRENFNITLARFDYLAQLDRKPDGLMMKEISRNLMVTGGNITTLTDELESEGLIEREHPQNDRRSWLVRLSDKGRKSFRKMAAEHERWILEIFSTLDAKSIQQLTTHLGALRVHVVDVQGKRKAAAQTLRGK